MHMRLRIPVRMSNVPPDDNVRAELGTPPPPEDAALPLPFAPRGGLMIPVRSDRSPVLHTDSAVLPRAACEPKLKIESTHQRVKLKTRVQ